MATIVTLPSGGDLGQALLDAYTAAMPDTTILMPAGTYTKPGGGTWTFNRTGPITLAPTGGNWLQCVFENAISVTGANNTISGIDIQNGSRIEFNAVGCQLFRSRIKWSGGKGVRLLDNARQCVVERCEFDGSSVTATAVGWAGIFVNDGATVGGANHRFDANYFRDIPQFTTGDDNSAIQVGVNRTNDTDNSGVLIRKCLFANCKGDNETVSIKASGVTVERCTFVDSQGPIIRQGTGNRLVSNWLENISVVRVYHRDHVLIGNRITGSGSFRILNGEISNADWDAGLGADALHAPSSNVTAIGNIGTLRIGDETAAGYTFAANGTRIEAHDGTITCGLGQSGTLGGCGSPALTTSEVISPAVKLTTADVGPLSFVNQPVRTFTASQRGTFVPPTFAALSAFSVEFWIRPAAFVDGHIIRIGSPTDGAAHKLRIRMTSAGAVQTERTAGAATQSSVSADGVLTAGTWTHVVAVFPSGTNNLLYIDGAPSTLTNTGAAVSGALSIASTDEIAIGDPSPAALTGFDGDIGRVTLWPLARGAQYAAVAYRHQSDFTRWVGSGAENRISDTNLSPVAVPVRATATSGTAVTIDVRPTGYDPNSGDTLSVVAGSASVVSGSGSVTITSGNLVFTPSASFTGEAVLGYTLQDTAGKRSVGRVYVTVSAATGGGATLQNPFNKWSAHHRPIGNGATYGIPPGADASKVRSTTAALGDYSGGVLGRRGRISLVREIGLSSEPQNRKYLHHIDSAWTARDVVFHNRGGGGGGLTWNGKVPTPAQAALPPHWPDILDPGPAVDPNASDIGDNEVILYDVGAGTAHVFAEFMFVMNDPAIRARVPAVSAARARQEYGIGGRDVRKNWNTPGGDYGPGAADWRHPGGFLQGHEVDLSGNTPIRHLLNLTATRHSGLGATAAQHIISRRIAYPAWWTDRPFGSRDPDGTGPLASVPDNQGDTPYGAILCIRKGDRGARNSTTASPFTSPYVDDPADRTPAGSTHSFNTAGNAVYTLNLTAFEKRLFDCFVYYGAMICDGQGQLRSSAPTMKLRVDHTLGGDTAKRNAVFNGMQKLIPLLFPIYNPRKHYETDDVIGGPEVYNNPASRWHGFPFVGGGGPIDENESVNTAYDAT